MKLNVNKSLTAEAERKARPVPMPSIKTKSTPAVRQPDEPIQVTAPAMDDRLDDILISQLEHERHGVMIERKKLSTRTASLVNEVYLRLKTNEGHSVAEEFMKGNIPAPEIAEHWKKIQDCTDKLIALYDRIEYVKQNGKLPEVTSVPALNQDTPDVAAITWEIRRLDDLIYKLSKKLEKANAGIKKPKNSERTNTWRTTMAMAEAKRDELKLKRKQLRKQ